MKNKKTGILIAIAVLVLILAGLWWIISHANKAPAVSAVTVLPVPVLSGSEALVTVTADDPNGDLLEYSFQTAAGSFRADHDRARWQAPAVDSVTAVSITAVVADPFGLADTGHANVNVVPVGWQGLMKTILQDTSVISGGQVALTFDDMVLTGDSIAYSCSATGGTFDTLPDGSIRWVAPEVDHDTTFVITVTAVNEKGEKVIKTMVVTVRADDASKEPQQGINHAVRDTAAAPADSDETAPDTAAAVESAAEKAGDTPGRTADAAPPSAEDVPQSGRDTAVTGETVETNEPQEIPAGERAITGTVRTTSGRVLPGVRIAVGERSALSGNDGVYTLAGLPAGDTLQLLCTAGGFKPEKLEAVIPEKKTHVIDVTMRLQAIGPPAGLGARTVPDTVYLTWEKVADRNLTGYAVYRSDNEYAGYDRVHDKPLVFNRFADATAEDSVKYYYRVATVNRDNVEGELSGYVNAVVPIKQFAVNAEYPSPYPNPTGIVYDGYTIWSCDNKRGEIYKHDWDLKVVQTDRSPGELPTGLAWDGRYLWSCDFREKYIFKHGKSMKVVAKFKGPGVNLTDLTWDGNNLWACDGNGKIYKLDEKCKVLRTYRSPHSLSTGIAWHDGHLWTSSIHTRKIYRLKVRGRELTVDDTYESPYLLSDGFACDGKYFWACGKVTEKMYKFSFK